MADITSLSASPSGRRVVFRIERASIARNTYSLDWYVADLETGDATHLAGGGAPIEGTTEPLAVETVVWSPDERFVYHRALIDGAIGISASRPTSSPRNDAAQPKNTLSSAARRFARILAVFPLRSTSLIRSASDTS